MDNQDSNNTQNASPTPPPVRRKRSFPLLFVETAPGQSEIMYHDEYAAIVAAEEASHQAREASRQAERAAGRVSGSVLADPAYEKPSGSVLADPAYEKPSESALACPPWRANPEPEKDQPSETTALVASNPSPLQTTLPPDFSRHARLCSVCTHPDRDAIEADFIRWRSPERIANDYQIADKTSIYRHAHATELFSRRKRELGHAFESIIENVEDCTLEWAEVIVRAARAYAHIDENGKWFEPPRTQFIFAGPMAAASAPEPLAQRAPHQFNPALLAQPARAKKKRPQRSSNRNGSSNRK